MNRDTDRIEQVFSAGFNTPVPMGIGDNWELAVMAHAMSNPYSGARAVDVVADRIVWEFTLGAAAAAIAAAMIFLFVLSQPGSDSVGGSIVEDSGVNGIQLVAANL